MSNFAVRFVTVGKSGAPVRADGGAMIYGEVTNRMTYVGSSNLIGTTRHTSTIAAPAAMSSGTRDVAYANSGQPNFAKEGEILAYTYTNKIGGLPNTILENAGRTKDAISIPGRVTFRTELQRHAGWNAVTGKFLVPVSGSFDTWVSINGGQNVDANLALGRTNTGSFRFSLGNQQTTKANFGVRTD